MAKIIADKREDIDFIILGNGEMWQQCQGFIKENKLEIEFIWQVRLLTL